MCKVKKQRPDSNCFSLSLKNGLRFGLRFPTLRKLRKSSNLISHVTESRRNLNPFSNLKLKLITIESGPSFHIEWRRRQTDRQTETTTSVLPLSISPSSSSDGHSTHSLPSHSVSCEMDKSSDMNPYPASLFSFLKDWADFLKENRFIRRNWPKKWN